MATGFVKPLFHSRALRPGDSSAPPPSFKKVSTRKPAGLSSETAPHKTELQHFDSKHGFPVSFGNTGMTGES